MVKMEETTPLEERERESPTKDLMDEVDLGSSEDLCLVLISSSLKGEEKDAYVGLLNEFKDVFAWSYKEMPELHPPIAVHHLNIRPGSRPHKQPQRKLAPNRIEKIVAEVQKLPKVGFIREEQHPNWLANVVPVTKKNGQIRVCINFRDLKTACRRTTAHFLSPKSWSIIPADSKE